MVQPGRYLFDNIFFSIATKNVLAESGSIIIWPPWSRLIIQDYGSADPDPQERFTDPIHCLMASNLSLTLKKILEHLLIKRAFNVIFVDYFYSLNFIQSIPPRIRILIRIKAENAIQINIKRENILLYSRYQGTVHLLLCTGNDGNRSNEDRSFPSLWLSFAQSPGQASCGEPARNLMNRRLFSNIIDHVVYNF